MFSINPDITISNNPQEMTYIGFVQPKTQSQTQPQNLNKTQDTLISSIMNDKNISKYNYVSKLIFDNETEMEQYYFNNPKKLIAGIIFNNDNLTSYTLRISGNLIPGISINSIEQDSSFIKHNATDYYNILAPIQMAVDNVILKRISNNQYLNVNTSINKLISPILEEDKFYPYYPLIVVFLINFIMMITIIYTIPLMVNEKENKLKEFIISSGVPPFLYWLSWIITNCFFLIINSILINSVITFLPSLLFSNDSAFYTWTHLSLSFTTLVIHSISLTNLSFLLAVVQDNLGTVTITSYTLLFLFSVIYTGFHFCSDFIQIIGSFLFSSVAIGKIYMKMLDVSKYTLPHEIKIFLEKDIIISLIGLVWCSLFYFGLAILFDFLFSKENQSIIPWKTHPQNKDQELSDSARTTAWAKDIEDYKGNEKVVVELDNLSKIYHYKKRQIPAVDHISLTGYKNEIIVIVGPNESGKTTLFNMLTGLINPTHGSIKYMGKKFIPQDIKARNCIDFCPPQSALIKSFTVMENIKFFSRFKPIEMERLNDILLAINLENDKNTSVKHLTSDQCQLLCIAIALSGNQPILVLDEPTKNVNKFNKKVIGRMISFFKKDKTVILISSDIKEAEFIADRTFFFSYGKIRCGGSNIFLKKHFNLDYELKVETNNQAYVNSMIQSIIPTSKYLPQYISSLQTSNDRSNLHTWLLPLNTTEKFDSLFKELNNLDTNNDVEKCYLKAPSLTDLYISLMNKEEDEKFIREELNEHHNENDIEVELCDSQTNSHQHFAININNINGNSDNENLIVKDYTTLPEPLPTHHSSAFAIIKQLIQLKYKIYFRKKSFIIYSFILPTVVSFMLFTFLRKTPYTKVVYPGTKVITPTTLPKNIHMNIDLNHSNMEILHRYSIQDNVRNNPVEWFNELNHQNLMHWNFMSSISGKFNNQSSLQEYKFDLYYNETMLHSLPYSINYITNLIAADRNETKNTTIEMNINPFPYIDINTTHMLLINTCFILNVVLILCSINKSDVVAQEREHMIINQLRISGIHRNLYWLSTMITDISLYMMSCFLIVLVGILCFYQPFFNIYAIIVLLIIIILK
ncbi:hypothetical protein PIROE2DRAFT_6856 [Piromyces sp. E2]|nr:hypothetical protein PIROE2DRAFT_6856 [Piromyces sp. E2]|eukprot:OUM66057.1 hypothetical protein PIROE2DRAFT_6856 [Piromyces sp. E2]